MDSQAALAFIPLLILLNGLYVAAEFAIVRVSRPHVARRAARGERLAGIVHGILRDGRRLDRFMAVAQLGITGASLGLGMYGEHVVARWIAGWLEDLGAGRWIAAHTIASVMAVALLTYLHIVLGEMVPKSIALQYSERAAFWVTPPMGVTWTLLYPVVVVLNALGAAILRVMGIDRREVSAETFLTADELQVIVQESHEAGALKPESARVIRELFEFGDLTAREVMVPRTRVAGLQIGSGKTETLSTVRRHRHSRYPVYEGDLDHILGTVHLKDLMRILAADGRLAREHVRPAAVVPETARLDDVLDVMRRERSQLLIVMDEHGGTAGIITLDDLFEEVIGHLDHDGAPGPSLDAAGRLRVPGGWRLDELSEQTGIPIALEEVDTVGGLILMLLDRVPQVGDTVEFRRLRLEVAAVEGHAVREAAVEILPPRSPDEREGARNG